MNLVPVRFGSLALLVTLACAGARPPLEVPPPTTAQPVPGAMSERSAKVTMGSVADGAAAVEEQLHGVSVRDPYRWLEDGSSADVQAWTGAQNAKTKAYMDAVPRREALNRELREVLSRGSVGLPEVVGAKDTVFHTKREGTQNQPVLYVREGVRGADRVLLDPSQLSSDGTTALDWWFPSRDGSLVAWGASENGSEESVLRIRDVKTGKDLPEAIARTRHASVAWLRDGSGFYYSRYPEAGTVPTGDEKYNSRIRFHKLGTNPKDDPIIFGEGRAKTDVPRVQLSPNGRWLSVSVHMGWDKNDLYLRDLSNPKSDFVPVLAGVRALTSASFDGDTLYLFTNDGAPKYQVFSVPAAQAGSRAAWKRVIAEAADVLEGMVVTRDGLIASYLASASTKLVHLSKQGKVRGEIALPGIGTAHVAASDETSTAFVSFTSYVVPQEVHTLGADRKLTLFDRTAGERSRDIEVSRIFATSKDGTTVPMFVIAKKGFAHDGNRPTVLSGYGGFNVNQTPGYNARALTVANSGGVWAIGVLRGGGEFGEEWHRAGMLAKKQNVFDDFLACAETLVREKVTQPAKLAALGGSNGGLLVAAAVTQRPDLFRAGASLVPLTDMLRFHKFRIGALWIPEYGSADNAEDFQWLYAYSPYHRVRDGVHYPAMLFTTAESDSRVDPMHARKMAARMQAAQGDNSKPILLRVESKAGHGAGKPISKLAEEMADELAFFAREIGF